MKNEKWKIKVLYRIIFNNDYLIKIFYKKENNDYLIKII